MSDSFTQSDRVLDWIPGHDPRNLNYPYRSVLTAETERRRKIHVVPRHRIDQSDQGACASFGSTNVMRTAPSVLSRSLTKDVLETFAFEQYSHFQRRDEWRDEIQGPGFGTSTNAAAGTLKAAGAFDEYWWTFGIDDLVDTVRANARDGGAAVAVGTKWLDGMFDCPPGTLMDVTGRNVGGHLYAVTGYHPSMRLPRVSWKARFEVCQITNSWGDDWGDHGQAWMRIEDMAMLLRDRGEGVVFVGTHRFTPDALLVAERALPSIQGT